MAPAPSITSATALVFPIERAVKAAAQVRGDGPAGPLHPEDHPGDQPDREDRHDAGGRHQPPVAPADNDIIHDEPPHERMKQLAGGGQKQADAAADFGDWCDEGGVVIVSGAIIYAGQSNARLCNLEMEPNEVVPENKNHRNSDGLSVNGLFG